MDPYLNEWLNLVIRFAHLITGIAWIGASFYFVWLDNHLQTPPQEKAEKGIGGDLWAIHGGGFYEVAKYKLAPPKIPSTLHWFKWEAYTTWITGFLLLSLMFYLGAETYLIDKRVADLTQLQAVLLGIGSIVIGVGIYEVLVRTKLRSHGIILGIILLLVGTALSYGLTQIFSARGAYMHMGAIIGTIMAGNVFFGIMPSQRALVKAVEAGTAPDPAYGLNAKVRSTHNTYTTLPILFIMISNHYPMTFNHSANWLVLMAIVLITAAVRQYFVLRHFGKQKPLILVASVLATIVLACAIAPRSIDLTTEQQQQVVTDKQVSQIIEQRCNSCHSEKPSDAVFTIAPTGLVFSNIATIKQWAPRIKARVIDAKDMPFMNKTGMTSQERGQLARWLAKVDQK
ncbi:urate hydroxylase PuuD [Colwellia sp. M166]|uniref:urate hydroxylase PuuD n=1 Tax=Colwellia sp. M166 TaxID=2583805 RepID=UPI00211E31C2|nr:urate hydroxylase PuuD [Colwellia sp. M166]UUO22107.1 urate hydroxylase PuuD [Colwellia sp. M166]|tara:strand:- start:29486 stop:30682 length:1197 start_codon:yes stop_codon:yes gene_type:complete